MPQAQGVCRRVTARNNETLFVPKCYTASAVTQQVRVADLYPVYSTGSTPAASSTIA